MAEQVKEKRQGDEKKKKRVRRKPGLGFLNFLCKTKRRRRKGTHIMNHFTRFVRVPHKSKGVGAYPNLT